MITSRKNLRKIILNSLSSFLYTMITFPFIGAYFSLPYPVSVLVDKLIIPVLCTLPIAIFIAYLKYKNDISSLDSQ